MTTALIFFVGEGRGTHEGINDVNVIMEMFVGGNAEHIGVVVAARFDGFDGRIANGGTDAFIAVGLHGHTLARTAEKDAKSARVGLGSQGSSNFFGIVIVIILGVVSIGAKIRKRDLAAFKPIDNIGFELKTAMVGAEVDVHIRIGPLDRVCRGRRLVQRGDCCSPIHCHTKRQL